MTQQNTTITLESGEVITLNDQQEEALEAMKAWLDDPQDRFFVLSGYAGTGKTTIVKLVIDYFLSQIGQVRKKAFAFGKSTVMDAVAVSAPTNKAKYEIQMSTGLEGKTIQSLLGLSPNVNLENFNINKPEFEQLRKPTLDEHLMVVIDEASMFNKDLFAVTVRTAERCGSKILFMCDEAQLPPVNESISPVISSELITSRYELTKVERQKGSNPLMHIYDAIRNNLNSSVDAFAMVTDLNENGEGIEFTEDLQAFGNRVCSTFASALAQQDPRHCKLLCWTNDRVFFWNRAIRGALYMHKVNRTPNLSDEDRELWKTIMPGDVLVGYTPTGPIVVSCDYKVEAVEAKECLIKYGSSNALSVVIDTFYIKTRSTRTGIEAKVNVVVHTKENLDRFLEAFNYFLDQAKFNRRWREYYNFKDKYHLLQDIVDGRGKLILRKDLDYSYALTVHKSQGSTYNLVFVDMPDINKNSNHLERNKLKYVAMSRPRQSVYVLAS